MKALHGFLMAAAVSVMAAACSPEEGRDVPEGVLRIFADRTTVLANGVETVNFTVMYGSEDVSTKPTLNICVKGEDQKEYTLPAGAPAFSTAVPGTYTFTAKYYYNGDQVTDNSVTVKAIAGESTTSAYYQKMLGMQFTSVGCVSCPGLSATVKSIQQAYPGRVVPVAFHINYVGSDPMYIPINDVFFSKVKLSDGLPQFAFNVRQNTQHIVSEYNKIVEEMEHQLKTYPAICGVAIESSVADGNLQVTARITPEVSTPMRCHIFLLEDGLDEYDQMGTTGDTKYIHNNVLRYCSSDNIWGIRLNSGKPIDAGKEFTTTVKIPLDSGWKIANLRVVVAAMTTTDGGTTYCCNNLNECAAGSSADYIYNENR